MARFSLQLLILLMAMPVFGQDLSGIERVAGRSLRANIESNRGRNYLTAGRNQFRTLWTRDFCFSARALLAIGRHDVVRNQLSALLTHQRSDGLLPRGLDVMSPKVRVVSRIFGLRFKIRGRLKPEYKGEHGTIPIDSNLLALLAARQYVDATGDGAWWTRHEPALVRAWRFYDGRFRNGLLTQPAFSDWQDSVRRDGPTFLTNLLYVVVAERLQKLPAFKVNPGQIQKLRQRIETTFFDAGRGLYRTWDRGDQVSIDGNLLAIDFGFHAPNSVRGRSLYTALKKDILWAGASGAPGRATAPVYPGSEISWTTWVAGLRHYHDEIHWSWLIGLSARVAARMGDTAEADRILREVERRLRRDGRVEEIYRPGAPHKPVRTWLYRSESPFSWGAAQILDAVRERRRHP